jgi:hypothetical protein
MQKISAEKIAAVLTEVPGTLRALDEERNAWRDRALDAEGQLAKHAQQQRIVKIASAMETKGLDAGRSMEERCALLEKKAAEGRLDAIEEAIEMSPANRPLGDLVEGVPGQAKDALTSFLIGDLV